MIKRDENIISWETNLFNAIKDVSDLDMQRKAWLGQSADFVSSHSEIISILYDDFDFERYIKYFEGVYGENELLYQMKGLDKLIAEYSPLNSDRLILSDPHWLEIVKKAGVVLAVRNNFSANV